MLILSLVRSGNGFASGRLSYGQASMYHPRPTYYVTVLVFVCLYVCTTLSVDRNLAEAVVSGCTRFIIASCIRRGVLRCFFSTLCGVIIGALLRGTIEYVLMGFKVLLSTISSSTGSSSKSED